MSSVTEIAEALKKTLSQARGWRFVAKSTESVDIGVDDSKLGGAYSPPRSSSEISGNVFIVWEDGRCSRGRVDSKILDRLPRELDLWRSLAYRDDDAAYIWDLESPADVKLFDPKVAGVVQGGPTPAFEGIGRIVEAARDSGSMVVDARVCCSAGETVVATSNGLWAKYSETGAWCYWYLDKTLGDSRYGRTTGTWEALDESVEWTARIVDAARIPASSNSGTMRVIMSPSVVDSFIGHYIAFNLSGENVAEGRSRYEVRQFRGGEPALRDDMQVALDTAVPMGPGSYPCTVEGVASGRADLIKDGRLVTPVLNLKYARRCNMQPTPLPSRGLSPGYAGMLLRTENMGAAESLLEECQDALLVCSVLGMHTQDPVSGNFSLAAPEAIVVKGGEMLGSVKAVISGNFFDALNSRQTRLSLDDQHPNPWMECLCHVEVG